MKPIILSESFERPTWDEYFMLQAELAKLRSNCLTRQVGAVIVRDHRQISMGYNGTPPGIKNCYEGGCKRCQDRMEGKIKSGESLDRCLCNHAEANAIMHCAILGIGIKRIICLDKYTETDYDLLNQAKIKVEKLDKNKIQYWSKSLQNL